MVENMVVVIREFKGEREIENMVRKLERNCVMECNQEVSIFTNMIGDPLYRVRFYPLHVMLVAEKRGNGELIGVVRGCIKHMGTKFGATYYNVGCILGLRVSPSYRRMGIGLELMKSMEGWMERHGAHYTVLATEQNNIASTTLFTTKCNYSNLSSLVIFAQPAVNFPAKKCHNDDQDIEVQKLNIDQAISFYNDKLRAKDIYPTDMDSILEGSLSLGTWVCYFKDEGWIHNTNSGNSSDLHSKKKKKSSNDMIINERRSITTPSSSWVVFSIWNSSEAYKYKFHIEKSHHKRMNMFYATLSQAKDKIFPCLKIPLEKLPFGFFFLYGIQGEGERVGELLKFAWRFAARLAEKVKDCKVIITEMGVSDPLIQHLPCEDSSVSCINDLWFIKKLSTIGNENKDHMVKGGVGNVFVDPRDF